jgi:hypothetical protein
MKYDLRAIMNTAWRQFKSYKSHTPGNPFDSFSKCLKWAWRQAKETLGTVTMTVEQYKEQYASCETAEGSYSKKWNTIGVIVGITEKARLETVERIPYSLYKREYEDCRTVAESYDKTTKTIEVYINLKKAEPRIHTWAKRGGRWLAY